MKCEENKRIWNNYAITENTNNSRGEDYEGIWYIGHYFLAGLWSTEVIEKFPFRFLITVH